MSFITNFIRRRLSGKVKYQKFFQKMYETGLYGMNYGNGGDFDTSGELEAVQYAFRKLNLSGEIVVFDVGANVGDYSKKILNLFQNARLSIYAFEPSKKMFAALKNNVGDCVKMKYNNIGLGREASVNKLYKNENISAISSVYKRRLDHYNIAMDDFEEIKITSLDEYCETNRIDKIDYLKLDVEGHEFEVLAGAPNMLRQNKIKFIQFEFGGTDIDSRVFFQDFYYLLKDNYFIYRIVKDGIIKIDTYNEKYEIFDTINFLAELK